MLIVVITTLIVLATTAVLIGRGPVRAGGRGSRGPSPHFGPPYDPALTRDDAADAADPGPRER
ncbi:hypothetical protein [Streptomyces sp. NPDC006446]|uniref:hypothetical protein n=1 Tax=Streptomyces sp. NPDC006446 TaxID=3154301 RepID=UPI0033BDBFC8